MGTFLTINSTITCAHGGVLKLVTSNKRTSTRGAAILCLEGQSFDVDPMTCKNSTKCTKAQFTAAATRSSVVGYPPLTEDNIITSAVVGDPPGKPAELGANSSSVSGK
jgi:hypothetical protein